MTVIYGITNCTTVKKVRAWLEGQGVDYEFSDFKKQPPSEELIENWLTQIPLETLLNKRGTTWRKLTPQQQAEAASGQGAVRLMAQYPSLIKRPVLDENGTFHAGFSEETYRTVFNR